MVGLHLCQRRSKEIKTLQLSGKRNQVQVLVHHEEDIAEVEEVGIVQLHHQALQLQLHQLNRRNQKHR